MTTTQARAEFDKAIARQSGNADAVARLELAREYFTAPGFAEKLAAFVYAASEGLPASTRPPRAGGGKGAVGVRKAASSSRP